MNTIGIVLSGVGGQGSLLAGKLMGELLLAEGYDVKVSEVHGMSQRGGSVVTSVRYGEKVYSPLICAGEADFVVAFELLEAARYAGTLKKGGLLITNTQQINPMPVITGAAEYPADILEKLQNEGIKYEAMDAHAMALDAGLERSANIVLLGRLARHMALRPGSAEATAGAQEKWLEALSRVVKPQFFDANKKAFLAGYNS
ncbi:MAG: indolepyruvate oxidoreductase subunit beta [Clostridia bacterium]|nr:indolepyruvate oxidoreductase subunit beta [Clostridia bacterium]